MRSTSRALAAALLLGASPVALWAQVVGPTTPPPAPEFAAQGEPVFVNRDQIYTYRALPSYNEPDWVKAFGTCPPPVATPGDPAPLSPLPHVPVG